MRGRKRGIFKGVYYTVHVEIYPREGTETPSAVQANTIQQVEIYPREGTETSYSYIRHYYTTLKFIPVRGRKHVSFLSNRRR